MRRSMLFLPGNNPNMLINADVFGADAVIFDLEDAVSPDEKDAARILIRNALTYMDYGSADIIVRINSIDANGYWMRDLEEVIPCKPSMIMPTKVSCADDVKKISDCIAAIEKRCGMEAGGVKILPLIETALGLENASAIATADARVTAVFLGAEDLTADMRCVRTKEGNEIFYARNRIVSAARAAGIDVYDTPYTDINDDEGLTADARLSKSLGFTGKAAISPRHVKEINAIFSPTQEEIDYAYDVMEAIEVAKSQGKGAIALNGRMIDAPIVLRAKQVIAMAEQIKGGGVK